MELNKYPQALQPSFWIVVMASGGSGAANIEFYQSNCVAYTKQEATQKVLKQLMSENPELYDRGQIFGGWRITHAQGISATAMETLFNERAEQEKRLQTERIEMEANNLLQQIIRDKDIKLFHQSIREGRINQFERLYLHEKLTEGKPMDIQ